MNEEYISQEQCSKKFWLILTIVVVFLLFVSGTTYALQSASLKSSEEVLQQQIVMLQNQIDQLQQPQQAQEQVSEQMVANEIKSDTQTEEQMDKIVYTNAQYGFSLTFPSAWKNYVVKKRTSNWGINGSADSFEFGLPGQSNIFTISAHSKSQWQKIKSDGGPTPTYLDENKQFTFGYTRAQDYVNNEIISRSKEAPSILDTFSLAN